MNRPTGPLDNKIPDARRAPGPWQPRYSLSGLMLVMLIFCIMGAAASYFVQSTRLGRGYQAAFIAVTLVAPLLLLVIVSNVTALLRKRRR
jgi:Na+/melibiose symporter-like transporter